MISRYIYYILYRWNYNNIYSKNGKDEVTIIDVLEINNTDNLIEYKQISIYKKTANKNFDLFKLTAFISYYSGKTYSH